MSNMISTVNYISYTLIDLSFIICFFFFLGVSITVTRKIMEGVSLLGITLCLLLLSLYGVDSDNFYFALSVIVLAFFCHGFELAGSSITSIDLTPSYSGLMFGIMNTISAIPG